jgi:Ni,Fe-hydrogenase III small subunit
MLESLKIWKRQGKQFIPDLRKVKLPESFSVGRPIISGTISEYEANLVAKICPTGAINGSNMSLDLGKCVFCKECERLLGKDKIKFTNDYKTATNIRNNLIINPGENLPIILNPSSIRKEINQVFGNSLKLRQVSAGGDNSCESELNAISNVNFDFGRYGIQFTASPRHSDGIVITGPITENMAGPLQICYDAIPNPKIVILVGTDAISGGIFEDSPALKRDFLKKYTIDLYIPGNPPHPLTIINGILDLIGKR